MVNNEELAYAAGIIDGEGTIQINKHNGKKGEINFLYDLYVRVSNTNPEMIKWLKSKFGGSITKEHRNNKNLKHRDIYQWIIASKKAKNFLELIKPYIVCKKEEVTAALNFRETYVNRYFKLGTPKEILDFREKCRSDLMKQHKQIFSFK